MNDLTQREQQVIAKLIHGCTNREIGVSLGLSEKTIKTHVTSILKKSRMNSRSKFIANQLWSKIRTLIQSQEISSNEGNRSDGGNRR